MAYPTVSKPYGLQPVNLIGGQVFAGATRNVVLPVLMQRQSSMAIW
jgi:hypothetical protein